MVTWYIGTRPILGLCEELVKRPGIRVSKWWWKQEGLELVGARAAAEVATAG